MGGGGERGKGKRYSFAKTPLKAAQAPLAAARASQEGDLKLILFLGSGGGGHSWCGGRRGSAAGSIEDFFQGRGGGGGVWFGGREWGRWRKGKTRKFGILWSTIMRPHSSWSYLHTIV